MAITNYDGLLGAARQDIAFFKTASATAVNATPFSMIDLAGNPGAGSLNPGNTANGIVPTDATAGAPIINPFGVGNTGYLSRVGYHSNVASMIHLYDRLFSVGSITMTTGVVTTTLASQPDFSARLPTVGGSPDYRGLEIWLETAVALSNHGHSVRVDYTDENDAAQNTGNISTQNHIIRRMTRFPLAAGGRGVKRIDSIQANGVASATGAFNVHVMRSLWTGRVLTANVGGMHGPDQTGMPLIVEGSSLFLISQPDAANTGVPSLQMTIVNG